MGRSHVIDLKSTISNQKYLKKGPMLLVGLMVRISAAENVMVCRDSTNTMSKQEKLLQMMKLKKFSAIPVGH